MDGARPSQDMDVLPREKRLPADRARRPTGARTSFLRRSRARRVRCALRRWRADIAKVAELADAPALGAGAARRGGSSPPFRTTQRAGSAPRGRSPCSGLETVCPVSSYLALDRHILARRSEEHTSELQSLMRISYAVFCLKKKKIHRKI